MFHVAHTSSSVCSASKTFCTPLITSHFLQRVTAGSALSFLNMERRAPTSSTDGVGLVVPFTETGGTFSHFD